MSEKETTPATPGWWSRQEVITGAAAFLLFGLFVGAVITLHRVADADSPAPLLGS